MSEAANIQATDNVPADTGADVSTQPTTTPQATGTPDVQPTTPADTVTPTTTPEFTVPEEYAEKGYMKGIDSNDALFKQFDSLNKLMGDRGAFIPKDGATDEQIGEFIDRLDPMKDKIAEKFFQAPESYEFTDIELPEGVSLSDDLTDEFSQMAKDEGLTNKQADNMRQKHVKSMLEREQTRQQDMNEQFDTLGKEMWGDQYETKLAETMTALEGKLDPKVAEALWDADPSVLIPIIALKHAEMAGGKPDGAPSVTTSNGMSDEQQISERQALRKLARENPTAANVAKFNAAQDRSRGKK